MTTNEPTTPLDSTEHSAPNVLLGPDDVREFAELVKAETGVELSAQEAWDRAIELIALVRMLIRPDLEDPENSVR